MLTVATRIIGTGSFMLLTAAAQYSILPVPFILGPVIDEGSQISFQPGDSIAQLLVKRQPAARLSEPVDMMVAGRHYALRAGEEIRPHYVWMSGASKIIPRNTLIYCTPLEKTSKEDRGGVIGVGSRYSTYVQFCLTGSVAGKFDLAFLAGSKSGVDRVPTSLPRPISYDLVEDRSTPTKLSVVYRNDGKPEIRLVLDDPDYQTFSDRDRRYERAYVIVRPKKEEANWTGFSNAKAYQGVVKIKSNVPYPYDVEVLDGKISIDGYDDSNKSLKAHVVSVPSPGPFRAVSVSTAPIILYY